MNEEICHLAAPGRSVAEHQQPVAAAAAQADGALQLRLDRVGSRAFIRLPKALVDVDSDSCSVTLRKRALFENSTTHPTACVLGAKVRAFRAY